MTTFYEEGDVFFYAQSGVSIGLSPACSEQTPEKKGVFHGYILCATVAPNEESLEAGIRFLENISALVPPDALNLVGQEEVRRVLWNALADLLYPKRYTSTGIVSSDDQPDFGSSLEKRIALYRRVNCLCPE